MIVYIYMYIPFMFKCKYSWHALDYVYELYMYYTRSCVHLYPSIIHTDVR